MVDVSRPRLVRLQRLLLSWYDGEARPLAWRRTSDAYRILVSEVMLQQTQAARVEPVYAAFVARFPTVTALAGASPADVLGAWRGLGYNRRAVALHRAARAVVAEHGGRIPDDLAALRALPGVGEYTARAVLAFGFGRDVGPVDTNVARVVARAVAGHALTRRQLQESADATVPPRRGRVWSAAVMDLGARHCTARRPRCDDCPLRSVCAWRRTGGADPAAAAAAGSRRQDRFSGSDRYHRGRLVERLRHAAVPVAELAAAADLADAERASMLAGRLVAEGLAEWADGRLRLPAATPGRAATVATGRHVSAPFVFGHRCGHE